jgi:hypothetical protein
MRALLDFLIGHQKTRIAVIEAGEAAIRNAGDFA